MSILQVTTLESNTVSANVMTAGETTVNSSGLYLNSTSGVINTSAIAVSNASGNVIIQGTMNLASITIGGTTYTSLVTETVNTQIFAANGTWTKPVWANTGNELVVVHMWGAGGGGNTTTGFGGGGGAMVFGYYKANTLANTANVVVGIGGTAGAVGGSSVFANGTTVALTAYGGGPANTTVGGGGGGWLSAGTANTGGGPLGAVGGTAASNNSTFGGGGGTVAATGAGGSIYGGGGGSGTTGAGGQSIYGGGGGAGTTGARGQSVYGGFGANSSVAANTPGGGGAGLTNTSGARGEVRVYTYRIVGTATGTALFNVEYLVIAGGGSGGVGWGAGGGVGGNSVYGGAGGSIGASGASSIFGGNGGFNGTAGSIPGGGGSSNTSSANTGARGEVRVWVFGPAGTTAGAPTYSLTANTTTLYEGSSVLYTVSTTNVANGTTLYYTLNNSSTAVATDFTTAVNGSVIINGGTGTFTLTANNDTDSANEAFQIDVRTGSTAGSIVASNGSVSIIPYNPITYIGSNSVANSGATTGTFTIALNSGLTGGSRSSVQTGDMVIAVYATSSGQGGADRTLSITDGTNNYTLIGSELFVNDTKTLNLRVAYKIMGATPDTSVTFGATGGTSLGGVAAVYVLSNVDQANPLDVSAVTTTALNSTLPNPASITPLNTGSVIVAVGAGSHQGDSTAVLYGSSDLTSFITKCSIQTPSVNSSDGASIGIGYKEWTSGAFDPAAFTFAQGVDSNEFCSGSVTLALRKTS